MQNQTVLDFKIPEKNKIEKDFTNERLQAIKIIIEALYKSPQSFNSLYFLVYRNRKRQHKKEVRLQNILQIIKKASNNAVISDGGHIILVDPKLMSSVKLIELIWERRLVLWEPKNKKQESKKTKEIDHTPIMIDNESKVTQKNLFVKMDENESKEVIIQLNGMTITIKAG